MFTRPLRELTLTRSAPSLETCPFVVVFSLELSRRWRCKGLSLSAVTIFITSRSTTVSRRDTATCQFTFHPASGNNPILLFSFVEVHWKLISGSHGRCSWRCRYHRWMQTVVQNCAFQRSEGQQGSRSQEILQEILEFFNVLIEGVSIQKKNLNCFWSYFILL